MSNINDITELEKEIAKVLQEDGTGSDTAPEGGKGGQEQPQQPQPDFGQALLAEIQALRTELTAAQQTAAVKDDGTDDVDVPKIDVPKISDEDLGALAQYRDKLEAIAKRANVDNLKPILDELAELKRTIKQLQEQQQAAVQTSFAQTLRAAIPDIDMLSYDPEFRQFLDQPAPFTGGKKLAQLLQEAYDQQNLSAVQDIVNAFKQQKQPAQQPVQQDALPDAYQQPHLQMSAAPKAGKPASNGSNMDKVLALRQKMLEAFRRGKLPYEKFIELRQKIMTETEGWNGEALH